VSYGHIFKDFFNNFWAAAFVRSMNYEDHWEHAYLLSLPINYNLHIGLYQTVKKIQLYQAACVLN